MRKESAKKANKLHRRDYYYIIGAVAAVAVVAIALSFNPPKAPEVIAHGETVAYHYHVGIEHYVDGVKQVVPADIGVPIDNSHPLAQHGAAGIAPIHTHDAGGTIHMESKEDRQYTFGDFLELWGLDLSDKTSATLFVNGEPVADMNSYILQDRDMLRLEVRTTQ